MAKVSAAWCLALVLVAPAVRGDDFKPESGFTLLFNGKDLSGWKTLKGGESLDGKNEAFNKRFTVSEGVITIDPKVKGDVRIETQKTFGKDVHIKFDIKPGAGCNNDLFLRGMKFDITKANVKNAREGEWNEFEIILKGDKAEYKCNGETLRSLPAKAGATPFGIRAEFGSLQIRRIRVSE